MTPKTHKPTGSNALLQKGDTSAPLSLSGLIRVHVRLRQALRAVGPAMPRQRPHEALRAALGAGLALSLSAGLLVVLSAWRGDIASFLLIAPLGASAFLLFAIPNSPLAQPWSAVVGNTASALAALAVLQFALPAEISVGLAVGGAIIAMASLRAMHPPGGAVVRWRWQRCWSRSRVATSASFLPYRRCFSIQRCWCCWRLAIIA